MKPTYFDLTVNDLATARRFFERVLEWHFERFEMPYEYYRIQAGPRDEAGIDGGIGAVADTVISQGRPMTQITVPVPDLDAVLRRVRDEGGSVIEDRLAVPGIGWYATCAEPGGLKFGVIQADPSAR
jgi:predicted enzyme related to lactoylglutathione lyase